MIRNKNRLKPNEFVGLAEYKSYLDALIGYLIGNNRSISLDESELFETSLVYGPQGSGKLSYLVSLLLERGWITIDQDQVCSGSQLRVVFVDTRQLSPSKLDILERLFDSIIDFRRDTTGVLVVVRNLEDTEREMMSRLVSDLMYFSEKTRQGKAAYRFNSNLIIRISWSVFYFVLSPRHDPKRIPID